MDWCLPTTKLTDKVILSIQKTGHKVLLSHSSRRNKTFWRVSLSRFSPRANMIRLEVGVEWTAKMEMDFDSFTPNYETLVGRLAQKREQQMTFVEIGCFGCENLVLSCKVPSGTG